MLCSIFFTIKLIDEKKKILYMEIYSYYFIFVPPSEWIPNKYYIYYNSVTYMHKIFIYVALINVKLINVKLIKIKLIL